MGFLGKILRGIQFIAPIILGIEPMYGAGKGDDKRNTAVDLIGTVIGIQEAVSGRDIIDEKKFQEGMQEVISGIVKMLNASVWRKDQQ